MMREEGRPPLPFPWGGVAAERNGTELRKDTKTKTGSQDRKRKRRIGEKVRTSAAATYPTNYLSHASQMSDVS